MPSASVTALTSLDFLGFGLPPGSPSLGELIAQGKNNLQAPWLGITGFFVVSGVGQAAAGFAVDRFGARRGLWLGVSLFALGALVLGLARGYPMLLAAALPAA